ncbi:MAG: hypothetical protein KAS38_17965 [Anaerolineales bacterium]|nr:hypothetical protein [Anaerolineales bacterium]MCK5268583.1 hypothetical protein [Spirochaetota bacterium]
MQIEYKKKLRKATIILLFTWVASFLTMMIVQLFMGGIQDVLTTAGRSFMIAFGLAVFIFLLPSTPRRRYPWQ